MPVREEIVGRIGRLVASAADRNPAFDLRRLWSDALMLSGIGHAEAEAWAQADDPLAKLLHFAGTDHGLAVLLVEEAISRQRLGAA